DLWVSPSDPSEYGGALADALASQIHRKGEYAILEEQDQFPNAYLWEKIAQAYISQAYPKMKLVKVIDGTGAGDAFEIDSVKFFITPPPKLKGLIGITPNEANIAAVDITQMGKVGKIFSAGNGDDRLGDTPGPGWVRSGATE